VADATRISLVSYAGAATGLGTFLFSLAEALPQAAGAEDWEVTVLLPAIDFHGTPTSWPEHLRHPRLRPILEGDASGGGGSEVFRDWIETMLVRHPADLAYFPNPYVAACPRLAVPMVATFHDFNHKRFESWSPDMRRRIDTNLPDWLEACAVPVVSSDFILSELAAYAPGAAGRARVVPLGIPAAPRQGTAAEWEAFAASRGVPPSYLLTVGWLSPHKNQAVLLEAVALLRDAGSSLKVVLVGPNSPQLASMAEAHDPYSRHMIHLADRLGLEHGRDFVGLGHVSDVELEMLYARAAALVMPTLYEAGSFPVREAMRMGCPVICSDVPPLREDLRRVGGDVALTFDPLSPGDLAAAAHQLEDDRAATETRAARARAGVEVAFNWEATAAGYVRAFTAAMDASKVEGVA
jgi:glycosyltransferase involved in cell wall biosynthesis